MISLALPKGRMQRGVTDLLEDAGIRVRFGAREYRPSIDLPNYDVKLLKPQNVLEMLAVGTRDAGFAGYDWVQNLGVDVVELMDTGLDKVKVVCAGKSQELWDAALNEGRHVVIASEYEKLTKDWIRSRGLNATFVRAYGATESFPPEDADLIVDNCATGSTLKANGLEVFDVLLTSTTRLYCSKKAFEDVEKLARLESFVVLLQSVLLARSKVLVEFNIASELLEQALQGLPSMRAPTIAKLHEDNAFSVKVAIQNDMASQILPRLKKLGASDIMLTSARQIIR